MKPIRVLHILHSMNRGGAENAIMNYYRHIDRDKVQFDFLLTEQDKCQFEDEILNLGGRVFRVPLLTIKNPFPYLTGVWRFYKSHPEYRIVHSHTSSKSFFPLFLAKRAGIPVRICHSHNSRSESGFRGTIRNMLKLLLRIVATHYMACSKAAAIWLYGHDKNVMFVPNVIEARIFDYSPDIRKLTRDSLGFSDSTLVIGCVARFNPQKNHGYLISLFEEFHHSYDNSILLLVGDGELRPSIENVVRRKGLSNSVFFVGITANVSDYMQAMDVFVLPSLFEGLGMVYVEAQVSGLRCFASEGVPHEVDLTGLMSFISLDRSPAYWAEQISANKNYLRRSHLDDIVKAGYDAPTSAQKLEQFYLETFNNLGYEN